MISINLVRKTLVLGLAQVMPRLPLILSAYLLTQNDYYNFNKYYYTASIIILWSSFGFDIGANIAKTKKKTVLYAILVNTVICSAIILLPVIKATSPSEIISMLVYSISAATTGVFLMRLLFNEKLKEYFTITLLSMILFIVSLIIFKVIGFGFFLLIFPGYGIVLMLYSQKKTNIINKTFYLNCSVKELYESGFLSFSINGFVPLIFAIDKYLINQNFQISIANSYIFAWGITSPIFYIGNIVEKTIYSSSEKNWRKIGTLGLLMTGVLISAYVVFILLIVNIFPSFLPRSIDLGIIKLVTLWMLLGYSIYSVFHFPLNGLLFKYRRIVTQKRVAIRYLFFAGFMLIVFVAFRGFILADYFRLLSFTLMTLFFLLLIKVFAIVFGRDDGHDE